MSFMRTLRIGVSGSDVEAWQNFLRGQGHDQLIADGVYNQATADSTSAFQMEKGLKIDGTVGPMTYAEALKDGFAVIADDDNSQAGPNWPSKPSFNPLSSSDRELLFGKFSYVASGTAANPEAITITDSWASQNIVQVYIPQLEGLVGAPKSCKITLHKAVVDQFTGMFNDWEEAGLIDRLKSFAGSWAPRFVRGSRTYLSNHAWGTAIDLNAGWNALGATPALYGKPGCVRELVSIANARNIYWGGHFTRLDGMHFESAGV